MEALKSKERNNLVAVLRQHAGWLSKGERPPAKETAKLLREAAKAIEIFRTLLWPRIPEIGGRP